MPGGRKVAYMIGGMGKKPDTNLRNIAPGKFTRHSRFIGRPRKGDDLKAYLRKTYDYPV